MDHYGSDCRRNSTCSSGSSTRRFRVGRATDRAKIQYIYGPVGVTSRRRPTYVFIPYPSILLICMTSKQWSTKSDHSLCPRVLLLDEPLTVTDCACPNLGVLALASRVVCAGWRSVAFVCSFVGRLLPFAECLLGGWVPFWVRFPP